MRDNGNTTGAMKTRPFLNGGRISRMNINIFQLCVGIVFGAMGMNVFTGNELVVTTNVLEEQEMNGRNPIVATNVLEEQQMEGWNPINVYYGEKKGLFNDTPPKYKETQSSFSQVKQDSIILKLLGPDGYFIDLAANDAVAKSNTLALERQGWTGLCVEPNPVYWYGLSHRSCTVVGALVSGTISEQVKVKFRGVFGGIVGKLDDNQANRHKEPDAEEVTRYTAPIFEVLQEFNVPHVIDYLSLDVEGSEYEIMKDFPFKEYTFKVISIERPNEELKSLLSENGYIFLAELAVWGEYLWCHSSTGFTAEHPTIKAIKL
jgi:hypothetical protein